jgi:hypothetical protein
MSTTQQVRFEPFCDGRERVGTVVDVIQEPKPIPHSRRVVVDVDGTRFRPPATDVELV